MTIPLIYFLNTIAASGGLGIATYIYRHKKKEQNKPLVCPLHTNCETVIHSRYSHFLGIPVEVLGMLYYGLSILAYLLFVASPTLLSPSMTVVMLSVSAFAFLFSLYLTAVQLFLLKQWCTWCLMSAGICTLIFFITLASW